MDGRQLDNMAMALVSSKSRRSVIIAMASLLVSGSEAPAKKRKARCKGSKEPCGKKCVDTQKDAKNCGGCRNRCEGAGATCIDHVCHAGSCPMGVSPCRPPLYACGQDEISGFICTCATKFDGSPVCVLGSVGCRADINGFIDCNADEDCGPGQACVDAQGPACSGCARGCGRLCNWRPF